MKITLAVGAALMCLSGCSNTLDQLRQMSLDDLHAAEAKAALAGDRVAMFCYEALEPIVHPPGIGIASDIEDARILAKAVSGDCSGILNPIIMLIRP